jgi:hypothetical protein
MEMLMKSFKDFMTEDGAPVAGVPTNSDAGIKPSIDNPPMGKKKQRSYQQKNAADETAYVKDGMNTMRKTLGGVNV